MESQMYGTPVIGARIGGIPELIEENKTGLLYESGNKDELKSKIKQLWENEELAKQYHENCKNIRYDSVQEYVTKLMKYYK